MKGETNSNDLEELPTKVGGVKAIDTCLLCKSVDVKSTRVDVIRFAVLLLNLCRDGYF